MSGSNHFDRLAGLTNLQAWVAHAVACRRAAGAAVLGVALAAGLFAAAGTALAGHEMDEFHRALKAHKIVSLQQLLAHVHRDFHARILKVELAQTRYRGQLRWIYEAKIMTPEGNVLELEYDANSLELLELEGEQERHRHERDDG